MFHAAASHSRGFALVAILPFVVLCAYVVVQALSFFAEQQRAFTSQHHALLLHDATHTGLQLAMYEHRLGNTTAGIWRALVDADDDVNRCVNSQGDVVSACTGVLFDVARGVQLRLAFALIKTSSGAVTTHVDADGTNWRRAMLTVTASTTNSNRQLTAWFLVRALSADEVVIALWQIRDAI